MFALLSSPIRRWILTALLVPVVGWLLSKWANRLERRNNGVPTRFSRVLRKSSAALSRLTKRRKDADRELPERSAR